MKYNNNEQKYIIQSRLSIMDTISHHINQSIISWVILNNHNQVATIYIRITTKI